MNPSLLAIVLAAGKGTRMKSAKAKVLHEVFFQPMIHHVLHAVAAAKINQCAVIVGHQRNEVSRVLQDYSVTMVVQEAQLGTGHAVLCAESACTTAEQVMILCGDTPLIQPQTLQAMISAHKQQRAILTLMTTRVDNPFGYGRILTGETGKVAAIVEEKDATETERAIQEINAGIYLVAKDFLFTALRQVGTDNSQGEIYLTDIVAIANRLGLTVSKFFHPQALDVLGVNSRVELAQAHAALQARRNREIMLAGVTLYDPQSTLIAPDCVIGPDTVIAAHVQISGKTTIGGNCSIDPGCVLHDCTLGDGVIVGANAVIKHSSIPNGDNIPPLTFRCVNP